MKNQNTLFAIGIPTINRADLLQEALEKYSLDFPNTIIIVVDNGKQQFDISKFSENIHFIYNSTNQGVSESWNQIAKAIFEY